MDTGKAADILNAVLRCQVHGAVERNPRGNAMYSQDCFEVKLILHYFLGLPRTSKDLNRPGWAAQRSHTLALAHSHPLTVDMLD